MPSEVPPLISTKYLKWAKLKATVKGQKDAKRVRTRRAGVLALCATTQAFPYTVPECLPVVVALLGRYAQSEADLTIKKPAQATVELFLRTHHDDWEEHKLAFTSEQLMDVEENSALEDYA